MNVMIGSVTKYGGRRFGARNLHFKKVGVVGLGLMGHGVGQIVAQGGYEVMAIEINADAVTVGMKRIHDSLAKVITKEVQKGKMTEAEGRAKFDAVMSKFSTSTNLGDVRECDFIIEAMPENLELKLNLYKKLGDLAKPTAVFASNTSSLQISSMALASGRPSQFVGLHFFNPVQIMKLVEIIRTEHTSDDVFDAVSEFGKTIGKTTVSCGDTPGFIVNRLLVPYLAQAMFMLDRGDASIADIDVSMQLGAGHPMGPLHLADYIGLDTLHHILVGWNEEFPAEPTFRIPSCLKQLVGKKHFGRKTGRGFYHWQGDKVGGVAE